MISGDWTEISSKRAPSCNRTWVDLNPNRARSDFNAVPLLLFTCFGGLLLDASLGERPEFFFGETVVVLHSDLIADVLFCDGLIDFHLNFLHDGFNIVLVLHLELLVMTPALVRSSFLEDFAEPKKDLSGSPGFLRAEVIEVVLHKVQVDGIFAGTPAADPEFPLIWLEPHFFDLMILGLETLLVRNEFFLTGTFGDVWKVCKPRGLIKGYFKVLFLHAFKYNYISYDTSRDLRLFSCHPT